MILDMIICSRRSPSEISLVAMSSGVAEAGEIGRLDGCSCSSGELGTSSSNELGGDIGRFVENCNLDGL